MTIPAAPLEVFHTLRQNGFEAWLVGGCVRDLLLQREPKDYDIATAARPDEIEALFPKTLAIGKAFGIITVVLPSGDTVEVATYRTDSPESADSRHPAAITFSNAREDALRRDFTINALYLNPDTNEIRDETGGRNDLQNRVIRAIGDPAARFREDALRMLRAIRFAGALSFTVDPATFAAIQQNAPLIQRISPERIREELLRMLVESPAAGEVLVLLDASGLLPLILPDVAAMKGVEQPPEFHPEGDVFTHTRLMLDAMPFPRSPALALAVLLHDVGKPPTAEYKERADGSFRWRFEAHADVGANMAEEILQRLRFPKALTADVATLIANHMRLAEAPNMRPAKLRRLLSSPIFEEELELHRLDCLSSHRILTIHEFLRKQYAAFAAEPRLPPPLVTGKDLIARGHTPGPAFSKLLRQLHDLQLEGISDKQQLLTRIPPP